MQRVYSCWRCVGEGLVSLWSSVGLSLWWSLWLSICLLLWLPLWLSPLLAADQASGFAGSDYYGASVVFTEYEEADFDGNAALVSVSGRLGHFFSPYLSGEVRAGTGIDGDSVGDTEIKLKEFFGGYLRLGKAFGDTYYPYLIVGLTRGETESITTAAEVTNATSDVSFGAGIDLRLRDQLKVNLEYIQYYSDGGVELSGFAIGATQRF